MGELIFKDDKDDIINHPWQVSYIWTPNTKKIFHEWIHENVDGLVFYDFFYVDFLLENTPFGSRIKQMLPSLPS